VSLNARGGTAALRPLLFGPALLACVLLASAGHSAEPKTHVVNIEGMEFKPRTLTVHRGDRVVWVNHDAFPHSATADSGAFDSKNLAPEASWTFVASRPGTYSYLCSLHPTMKATLKVE
jgi:plastocyanin